MCNKVFRVWNLVLNNMMCVWRTWIIIGWNPSVVNVEVVEQTNQVVHCHVTHLLNHKRFLCSFFYASNNYIQRIKLWESIVCHKFWVNDRSWVIVGDFNVSLNPCDKHPGSSVVNREMSEFRECLNKGELEDMNQTELKFTWVQKLLASEPFKGVLKKNWIGCYAILRF